MLDFFATYLLLGRGGIREMNPVAGWFLEGWGRLKGLLFYKLALVAFVCVIVQVIALKSEQAARRVLLFGIAVVMVIVIYSVVLLTRSGGL